MEKKRPGTITVTGDLTLDWNIARVERADGAAQTWTAEETTVTRCQRGGVAMLGELIEAVAADLGKNGGARFNVRRASLPGTDFSPADARFHHSYAMWKPYNYDEKKPGGDRVWRVAEFLGLDPCSAGSGPDAGLKEAAAGPAPDIIVLDDANLGFRDRPELWPHALTDDNAAPWVLVKTAGPVAQGALWAELYRRHAARLIIVMTAEDLRGGQVQISRRISWERTAQELVWELTHNPQINMLGQCAHVIVSFGPAGAALLSNISGKEPAATLFFDPLCLEDEWGTNHKGSVVGYTSCLAAGIARGLMLDQASPDIPAGIQAGVRAMRLLHKEGYGRFSGDCRQIRLAFPAAALAAALADGIKELAAATIRPEDAAAPQFWTILADKNPASLETLAEKVVREGLESALQDVPVGQFGRLKTVDRREIESLHGISTLIQDYGRRRAKTPLSIAVFGPPGSGKSFSVEEVARAVMPDAVKKLTFNLSQFTGLGSLHDAFHQVRDAALTGQLPLVFWDEFDAPFNGEKLGWLRYFLAPMQDGEFQAGQLVHPIGRCIFVFAGGTSHTYAEFAARMDENRAVKLPDFVSRLKGFLDILGPNRRSGEPDPYYIIRRAIVLRSNLERLAPGLLHRADGRTIAAIDQGVLRAFLLTREYRHGARSMEAVLTMSRLSGQSRFERSCLPPEAQLNLHVDGLDFAALVHRIDLSAEAVEKLARACHEVFLDSLKAKHYRYGPVTDPRRRTHSSFLPYDDLPEYEKEQNRDNVRDIPEKLTSISCVIVPTRGHERQDAFTPEETEKLAVREHERYVREKLADGWKYARVTDKAKKLHKALVDWAALPEPEREKDRLLVRGIPRILAKAGYKMVKTGE